eukprot:2831829-Pleurochrysis_carterae.AAC.3
MLIGFQPLYESSTSSQTGPTERPLFSKQQIVQFDFYAPVPRATDTSAASSSTSMQGVVPSV